MADDPFALFDAWFAEAKAARSTIRTRWRWRRRRRTARPSVRMVLLKGHGPDGFTFYTNARQPQGRGACGQSARRPALPLEVAAPAGPDRRTGRAGAATREADAYFATRCRDSQLGAWASDQSRPLDSRATFETRYEEMTRRFEGQNVPRPPRWSGFRVMPELIEFWTDRPHRLHERRAVHASRRRLERRTALPMSGAHHHGHHHGHAHGDERATLTARAAMASIAMALFLVALKTWAALGHGIGGDARLASPTAALDLIASLITFFGRAVGGDAGRRGASLRPRQGGGAGRADPGHPDHPFGAGHRLARQSIG